MMLLLQPEKQIPRRRRDGDAVCAVARADGVTARRPARRRRHFERKMQRQLLRAMFGGCRADHQPVHGQPLFRVQRNHAIFKRLSNIYRFRSLNFFLIYFVVCLPAPFRQNLFIGIPRLPLGTGLRPDRSQIRRCVPAG